MKMALAIAFRSSSSFKMLVLAATLLSGCSFVFVRKGPPPKRCNAAFPLVDSAVAVIPAAMAAAATTWPIVPGCDYLQCYGSQSEKKTEIAVLTSISATFLASAAYGFFTRGQCPDEQPPARTAAERDMRPRSSNARPLSPPPEQFTPSGRKMDPVVQNERRPTLEKPTSLLVLDLKPIADVPGRLCQLVTRLLLSNLDGIAGLRTVATDDIEAMLDVQRKKDLLACDTTTCLAEIGGALGAELVLAGQLGVLGTRYNVNLTIIDSRLGSVRGRVSWLVDADEDRIADNLPNLAAQIVTKLNEQR